MSKCCPKTWLKFFKAIHDEHRHKMLEFISEKEKVNVSDVVKKMKLSQPTVSHHLKILHDAEIITAEKKGKEVFYSINQKSMYSCCQGFLKHFHCLKK